MIKIIYNVINDTFDFESKVKKELISELLADFLRCQFGKGVDTTPPDIRDEYVINIKADLTAEHNCGNLCLRDGLLSQALNSLKEN